MPRLLTFTVETERIRKWVLSFVEEDVVWERTDREVRAAFGPEPHGNTDGWELLTAWLDHVRRVVENNYTLRVRQLNDGLAQFSPDREPFWPVPGNLFLRPLEIDWNTVPQNVRDWARQPRLVNEGEVAEARDTVVNAVQATERLQPGLVPRGQKAKKKIEYGPSSLLTAVWPLLPTAKMEKFNLSEKPDPFPWETYVGVEVEVERWTITSSAEQQQIYERACQAWSRKNDGSLRNNGVEFVTFAGLKAKEIFPYTRLLFNTFDVGRVWAQTQRSKANEFSHRCGLHVHIDMTGRNLEAVYKSLLVYSVVEPLLFLVSGNRKDNKFCVSVHDCRSAVEDLIHYGHAGRWDDFIRAVAKASKYTALNVAPLRGFGTLEFRQHEGTHDPQRVINWVSILCDMVERADRYDVNQLEQEILALNTVSAYEAFLHSIFPNTYDLLVNPGINLRTYMYDGVAFVKQAFISDPNVITNLANEEFI